MRILESKGARCAQTLADCAAHADAVISCLPSPQATEEVIGQLKAHFTPNACWIEMGTKRPRAREGFGAKPCFSGGEGARSPGGQEAFISQNEERSPYSLAETRPCFSCTSRLSKPWVGAYSISEKLGSASSLKIITNMLAFIHLIAAGEALMLAKLSGLDLAQAFHAIKASSGNSFVHETEGALILNGSYNIGFTMQLACKDLNFARQLARKAGMPLEFGEKNRPIIRKSTANATAQTHGRPKLCKCSKKP